MEPFALHEADCLAVLPTLPDASHAALITDVPYPYVKRPYGYWNETQWRALMDAMLEQARRVLTPTGSALLVMQPNSEHVGQMRSWVWRFLADWTDRWNVVQDFWWFNPASPPTVHCHAEHGLARPSVKVLLWLGPHDCHRDQAAVRHAVSQAALTTARTQSGYRSHPSGQHGDKSRACRTAVARGGATPFNLLSFANTNSTSSGGAEGHEAAMPLELARWWVRYLTRPGDRVLDPFMGRATTGIAALEAGRLYTGVEVVPRYLPLARRNCARASAQGLLALGAPAPTTTPANEAGSTDDTQPLLGL